MDSSTAHADTYIYRHHKGAITSNTGTELYSDFRNDQARSGVYIHDKKSLTLPLISRVAAISDPVLAIDLHATQMYQQGVAQFSSIKIDEDYKSPPIRF